mmetsp:Transcript_1335/g.1729  ORF Transcript_1335/g.1729 Transcript_1335/m.1729 type:complete len:109 (+) Transcript_1335:1313-1639(+)
MIKLFQSFVKSNVVAITKTNSLLNNIISFSRDQLKQKGGLDLTSFEKASLKSSSSKVHDTKVAFNILLFLCRHHFIRFEPGKGKQFSWNHKLILKAINEFIPPTVEAL